MMLCYWILRLIDSTYIYLVDPSTGMLYPNDSLLKRYINFLEVLGRTDEIKELLSRLINLKYPLDVPLFNMYLDAVNDWTSGSS